MTPMADTTPAALRARFIDEAERVSAKVWPCADDAAAIDQILALLGSDTQVMAWDFALIPLAGLREALAGRGVSDVRDTDVRVGITGVEAALATTGSLILQAGEGKPRAASLLPPLHIAIVRETQLLPDLEAWFDAQRADGLAAFRASANTVIVTGGSRTADIGQELILGAHGPVEVHIVLVP